MNTNTKKSRMKKYYSLRDPEVLLATVLNSDVDGRVDAASTEEILQASVMCLSQNREVRNHQHLPTERTTVGTQEAWVVIRGVIEAQLFDTDRTPVTTFVLGAGDCMVLYRGAHGFRVLEQAVIYEIKNGPYLGADKDSVKI